MVKVVLTGYKDGKQVKKTIKAKDEVYLERKIVQWSRDNRIGTFTRSRVMPC